MNETGHVSVVSKQPLLIEKAETIDSQRERVREIRVEIEGAIKELDPNALNDSVEIPGDRAETPINGQVEQIRNSCVSLEGQITELNDVWKTLKGILRV